MENNTENYSQYCFVVGATDVGKKRAANEDYLGKADTPNGRVVVVCDGMGGHVGGATASHIAVETILDFLRENFRNDPREAIGEAIDAANQTILNHARTHPELTGMGSTCVLLLIRNGKVYIGHVGDSRIYLVRSKIIRQLTVDHSYVQELVDAGAINKEQAEHHPRKNEITNALGIPNMKPATVRDEPISPEAGDVFLLCSDGLSNMVDDKHIAHIASNLEMTTQQRADTLVQRANDNGGLDNITCALVEFSAKPESVNKVPFWKKKAFVIGAVAAVMLICGIVAWQLLKHPKPPKPESLESARIEETIEQSMENVVVEPRKEQVNLGEISIRADQQELLTIEFEQFFTLINDSEGKVLNRIDKLDAELNSASVKPVESIVELLSNERKVVLKLTKSAGKMKKKLVEPLHFTMQNETKLIEFSFTVKVKESDSDSKKENVSGNNKSTDSNNSNKPEENPDNGESKESLDQTFEAIRVNKDGYKIALFSSEPEGIDDYDYHKKIDYAFVAESKSTEWYTLTNNGNLCSITIPEKDKIPFKASIQLTIKRGEERGTITLPIVKSGSK